MENNYQLSRIHNYVNGLMAKEEMHAFEREALDDPFLQDAIDGYKLQNGVNITQLSILQQQLSKRIATSSVGRHKQYFSWQRLAIGLTAAVLFVTVSTLLLIRYLDKPAPIELINIAILPANTDINLDLVSTGDAVPIQGWDVLEAKLLSNEDLSDFRGQSIKLKGVISASGELTLQEIQSEDLQLQKMRKFLTNDIKWSGKQLNFTLVIK